MSGSVRLDPAACYVLWRVFLERWATEREPCRRCRPCLSCRPWAMPGPHGRAYRVALAEPVAAIREAALAFAAAAVSGRGHVTRQPDDDGRRWEATAEAAARLGVDPRTVRRWAEAGRLPARKLGDRWLIDADARPEERQ